MGVYSNPLAEPWWLYRAIPEHVVDGDTLDLLVDQGMRTFRAVRVRLANVDTAEIYGPDSPAEYQRGLEHAAFVKAWLSTAEDEWDGKWPLIVATDKDDTGKYGRYIGRIQRRCDGEILNRTLRDEFDV